jgi:hypothetical protein
MPHEQNAVQNDNKNTGNKSSEGAAMFKYWNNSNKAKFYS